MTASEARASADLWLSDAPEAERTLRRWADSSQPPRQAEGLGGIALIRARSGDDVAAERLARKAFAVGDRHGLAEDPSRVPAQLALAQVIDARGDGEGARALLEQAVTTATRWSAPRRDCRKSTR